LVVVFVAGVGFVTVLAGEDAGCAIPGLRGVVEDAVEGLAALAGVLFLDGGRAVVVAYCIVA
jgi:hypothetical protein